MRGPVPILALGLAAALLPLVPGFPPFWVTLLETAAISAIAAVGLVVLTGTADILSFGQAMFVGLGAYATAVLTATYGLSPWLSLPVSLALSGLVGLAIGAVTLRLRGHYLAVATIAWNMAFFYLAGNLDLVHRFEGMSGLPPIAVGNVALADPRASWYVVLAALLGVLLLTRKLLDSRAGRAVRSLRGGRLAAESCGVDTFRARVFAFVYAAVLAGLAGWLYAHVQRAVNPSPFSLFASVDLLLMAVAGGIAHLGGALVGALLVTAVHDRLEGFLPSLGLDGGGEAVLFGIAMVLILQFAPEGLWPHLRALVARGGQPKRRALPEAGSFARRGLGPAGGPLLAVRGLRKRFGGLVAVDGIGFDVAAGEIVALIGPNGAGKSTSFNLVSGTLAPTDGTVRFRGRDVSGRPARAIAALGLARTFQHGKLVHGMSVIDNVAVGAHLRGRAGALRGMFGLDGAEEARIYALARRELGRVGLAADETVTATDLALGRQRLVEIARALCLDPALVLLDEPAAGLRHAEKGALAALLRQLRAEGLSVLLVEHDMEFVMGLADRVVVMNFGAELSSGRPAEVRADPAVLEAYLGAA